MRRKPGVIVLGGLLFAGCGPWGSAQPASTPSAPESAPFVAAESAGPPASPDCYGVDESVDHVPYTIKAIAPFATAIVIARVDAREPGEWNTDDGARPGGSQRPGPGFIPGIVTPSRTTVVRVLAGDAAMGPLRVFTEGGEANCVVRNVMPSIDLVVGSTCVLFLGPGLDVTGVRRDDWPTVMAAWRVVNGRVHTEQDGDLTLDVLAAAIVTARR